MAMAEPAEVEPDEHGQVSLRIAGKARTYYIDHDGTLVPVTPWPELEEKLRRHAGTTDAKAPSAELEQLLDGADI